MSYYPDWNPTPRSAITWAVCLKNLHRPDAHRVIEATECSGPAAQAAQAEFCERLEGCLKVQNLLSVDRSMARNLEDVRYIAHTHEYFVPGRGAIWNADSLC